MIDASSILGSAAQVAITLVGFAGVVVVFATNAVHAWSPIDKFRLSLMLRGSSMAVVLALIGQLLLATELQPERTWRIASGFAAALAVPGLIGGIATFRRFSAAELAQSGASHAVFYTSTTMGFLTAVLQVANALWLATFWPFLFAVVGSILVALLQFVRLIVQPRA